MSTSDLVRAIARHQVLARGILEADVYVNTLAHSTELELLRTFVRSADIAIAAKGFRATLQQLCESMSTAIGIIHE